jgi:hypothetical protein
MKLEIKFLEENEDGSANITVEYDKEAHNALIQKAIEVIIMEYLDKLEDE